ncbi:MAG TPA: LOG family protein [Burkholderiales bacterium]|nr:LOG family protein [Burkholderiales bacterium]
MGKRTKKSVKAKTGARYLEADRDPAFLQDEETRGVRLQLEYYKAERQLRRHGVRHTILVLGSTRIREVKAGRGRQADGFYAMAREFGRIVGAAGRRHGVGVMTGGGPGLMEAANRGALEAGAPSIGLNIVLPFEQRPNPYLTPGLCLRFRYFALRKLHFLLRARALVAFPGGFGTFDELFETLTLVQTRKIRPMPIVLAGESYWRRAFDLEFLIAQRVVAPADRRLFCYAESAAGIWKAIRGWYAARRQPMFPPGAGYR